MDPEGPVLVEGPVEIALDDGTVARSDRFMVAVCTCRRSRAYPWCDTSHRRRERAAAPPGKPEAKKPEAKKPEAKKPEAKKPEEGNPS
ncbi:hypothetical protein CG724_04960 [Streptomyces sp. CB02120-2]|nr:hypothetical protein CG724_04960 [Streptomyces sp. CB02120-2]